MSILLSVASGFASGVILRPLFVFSWPAMAFIGILAVVFAIVPSVVEGYRRQHYLIALFLICVALGMARMHVADAPPPAAFLEEVGSSVSYEGVVVDYPDRRDTQQRVTVEVQKGSDTARILVVALRYPAVAYGDRVRVEGTLALPEPFDTDAGPPSQSLGEAGRVFRYDKFLQKDGISFLLEFAEVEVLVPRTGLSLYGALFDLKDLFTSALARALPEPAASLAGGLLLGGKQGLGDDLKQAFTTSGLIHVVVLSGYNVMIVAVAVLMVFGFLPRRIAAGLAALTIALFVLMAGAGAASIRAGLMAGIGLYARANARTFDALRALLVVGLAMVVWNPLILLNDPGFELSIVATLGLIVGAPLVAHRLTFIKSTFLLEIASSTIAAQIAVLPLLLYQTGLLSLVALPANLLILPAVPLAMGLAFFAGLVALIAPPLALVAGAPAYLVLSYIIAGARVAAALPLAAFSLPAFSFVLVPLAYAALAYLAWRLYRTMPMPQGERVELRTHSS